jgi:outer membrane receptor for ferrienterochelin and colicin
MSFVLAVSGQVPAPVAASASAAPSGVAGDQKQLQGNLIYSVDRVPERLFDTSRAVEVITQEQIERSNSRTLADLLEEHAGLAVTASTSGGMPIARGLSNKQVMLLIDGVKVNNATWGANTREYLGIIALDQIDRIEVVRGVVSVLGTESLGGVVNIITKKGSPNGSSFGGTLGARYGSADRSVSTPLELFGSSKHFRFNAGVSAGRFGDLESGAGKQGFSAFKQRSGFANGQVLLSPEKTLGFGYQYVRQTDVERPGVAGTSVLFGTIKPSSMQIASLSYQDLTSRSWEDSLRVTAYWNRQSEVLQAVTNVTRPPTQFNDSDALGGFNLELGTFVKSHHLLYGVDYSAETASSSVRNTNATTGAVTYSRGNEMDGSKYRALGVYLQDRVDAGRWLTVIAGARYGRFKTSGREQSATIGNVNLDGSKSDVTGAINLIGHITPHLNVIGNAFRGFRAPNLDDMTRLNYRLLNSNTIVYEIPNTKANPERVTSYELGLKYDNDRFQGSVFAYRNRLTDLLQITPSTFNGLSFLDSNRNGVKERTEFNIVQNLNVGTAIIKGFEVEGRYRLSDSAFAWFNYTTTNGTDTAADQPLPLVPAAGGTAGLHYAWRSAYEPWAELVWRHANRQTRISAAELADPIIALEGIPGFDVIHLRTGAIVTPRLSLTAAVENLTNETYRQTGSLIYSPGRQFVLGTRIHF